MSQLELAIAARRFTWLVLLRGSAAIGGKVRVTVQLHDSAQIVTGWYSVLNLAQLRLLRVEEKMERKY